MQPDRYAVFGHPISHSQSPRIHALFAEQTGQFIQYSAQDVSADQFRDALSGFIQDGGRGLNCTVPLKEVAWSLAGRKSLRADRAKAVNTLVIGKGTELFGDNTDGVGLLRDLSNNLNVSLRGRNILLLGAGGASRGILQPILAENPRRLLIANRTVNKAEMLAKEFADLGVVEACGFDEIGGDAFDLILNATAASLNDELPTLTDGVLAMGGICYDLAYGKQPTAFVKWGKGIGASLSVDGIGMLVEQAAESFLLWRGVRPETRPVIELLNAERGWVSQ